jgi:hypothetical protein
VDRRSGARACERGHVSVRARDNKRSSRHSSRRETVSTTTTTLPRKRGRPPARWPLNDGHKTAARDSRACWCAPPLTPSTPHPIPPLQAHKKSVPAAPKPGDRALMTPAQKKDADNKAMKDKADAKAAAAAAGGAGAGKGK